jgi:hypothetical protein
MTINHAWLIREVRGGKVRRWGALVFTIPGEHHARAHITSNDWGKKLQSSRTKGDVHKLTQELEDRAVGVAAASGNAQIHRFPGGSVT